MKERERERERERCRREGLKYKPKMTDARKRVWERGGTLID